MKRAWSALRGGEHAPEIPFPVSQQDGRFIAQRIREIERHIKANPSEEIEVGAALAGLFACYPATKLSEETLRARAHSYLQALSDKPAWAIVKAVERWIAGDVDIKKREVLDFPPSAARLRALAADELTEAYRELTYLRRLSRARVVADPPEEERRRVAERMKRIFAGEEELSPDEKGP